MYQAELFSRTLQGEYIAGGCFGSVYVASTDGEWVVKTAIKDGTLNYLEWCKRMQDAGKGMKGMPEIDVIVHLSATKYMVTMRRYACTMRGKLGSCYSDELGKVRRSRWCTELEQAYCEYASAVLGPAKRSEESGRSDRFGDLHASNIMWDERTEEWVVTDPDATDYLLPKEVYPFQMYVEAAPAADPVPVLPRAVERPKFKPWTAPQHTAAVLNQRLMDDMILQAMRDVEKMHIAKPRNRIATSDLRRLPDVQMAEMPSFKLRIGDALEASLPKMKVRRANTEEKRKHYEKNKPPLQWFHHGRRW